MIATRDIAKDEEVVNDYGSLSNAELLRAYGYVERQQQGQADGGMAGRQQATGSRGKGKKGAAGGSSPVAAGAGKKKGAQVPETGSDGNAVGAVAAVEQQLLDRLAECGVPGNMNSHVQVRGQEGG
jgi:hypothetical protein